MSTYRWRQNQLLAVVHNHLVAYPTAANGRYMYRFGSLRGMVLVIQLVTGIFLAMHYTPHVDYAFRRVEHIMRDVNNGWLMRYLHANGARFFFIMVYIHVFRGLYYGSYGHPREALWCSGVVILFLMVLTAFIGYVLPWGQMRFWGATVITNFVSAVPFVGESITQWIWGGFSVDNATLNRFFRLHYLMPFLITGLVLVHLTLLHVDGSRNPLGVDANTDKIPFYPYYYVKDLLRFLWLILALRFFVFFYPNLLGHPDNYIPANPMVTPPHIVPEWYFLPFYAILRSIPHKLGGVVAMGLAIVGLAALPFINTREVRSTAFRPIFQVFFWFFVADCLILGWLGQNVVEHPYVIIGQLARVFYFGFLFVGIPLIGKLERVLMRTKV